MAKGHSYMSSLEDLQSYFMKVGKSRWKLLRGFQDSVRNKTVLYQQDNDSVDVDESWALLEEIIKMNCGGDVGRFTVFIPTQANNQGVNVHIQIGEFSNTRYPKVAGPAAAGLVTKEDVEEKLNKERRIWELERSLEDIMAAQEANAEWKDVLMDKLREVDLEPVINGFMHMFAPRGVKLQGTPADFQQPTAQASESTQHGAEEGTGYDYPGEHLLPILDTIRQHFESNEEFLTFLASVAHKFNENPTMYKNLLMS